ncbi:MAG TPA: RAMP superfamily CRISPR-associated protein, partial [Anaerolineae bacterium]|nr:RAMP superfamily CRISPR-associated protein [Anaerolineae bacterium]
MAKQGTVARIVANSEYGFIKQDDGGSDVYFKLQWIRDVPVTVGLRVEYEIRETARGLQTSRIKAIGQQVERPRRTEDRSYTQHPSPPAETGGDYRFLNPYNFVRYLDARPQGHILGDCPPPPHDRYVGLTGRITCAVEAVTPLFISDSHGIEIDPDGEKDHKIYRFFEYEGQPALPASSLRGMVRSVYEAVTNSCLSVFEGAHLSEHFEAKRTPWLVPARVEFDGKEWTLRLLTGETPLQIETPGIPAPRGKQYAAWVASYWPVKPSK